MLQAFLTELHTKHNRFYIYFGQHVTEKDVYTANTNMLVESFNSVLKVVNLHHKQNRHVDSLLVTLIKSLKTRPSKDFARNG